MVVLQHSIKPLTAFDFSSGGTSIFVRLDELIPESLMIPLGVVMLDVFAYSVLQ